MSEKGGTSANKNNSTVIDTKVVLTTAICFLAGAAIVMGLILFGMEINKKYMALVDGDPALTDKDNITEVISVKYDSASYSYRPEVNADSSENQEPKYYTLLKKLNCEKYCLIKSNTEYEDAINQVNMLGGRTEEHGLQLEENFFNSGSVILITSEMEGLSYFGINSITRDGDYNIYINTSSIAANDTTNVEGDAVFIKIENIQPKYVELTERAE
jgi:hypothetical protein